MYKLNTLHTHRHRDAAVALMLCDELTHRLIQTFRKIHFSLYIVSQTGNLMNDKLVKKRKKRCSGTWSGLTISLLTVRPQLCAATVFAHWKLAWQLPDPDNTTGCQNKLWSLEGSRWRGQHRGAGGNCMKQYERKIICLPLLSDIYLCHPEIVSYCMLSGWYCCCFSV